MPRREEYEFPDIDLGGRDRDPVALMTVSPGGSVSIGTAVSSPSIPGMIEKKLTSVMSIVFPLLGMKAVTAACVEVGVLPQL